MYNLGFVRPIERKNQAKSFTIPVSKKDQNKRLDQFLSEADLNLSRSRQETHRSPVHTSQRKTDQPSVHVKTDDRVSGILPNQPPLLEPEALPFLFFMKIHYHCDDKPAGWSSIRLQESCRTLVNALIYHCKDFAGSMAC